MKKSEIKFSIELDPQLIPEKIYWEATDSPTGKLEEAKAITIGIWDADSRSTLKFDLWTKDMPVQEMKLFYLDIIGAMAKSLEQSTGDLELNKILEKAGKDMMLHIQKELK